jgi:hypothetical protein
MCVCQRVINCTFVINMDTRSKIILSQSTLYIAHALSFRIMIREQIRQKDDTRGKCRFYSVIVHPSSREKLQWITGREIFWDLHKHNLCAQITIISMLAKKLLRLGPLCEGQFVNCRMKQDICTGLRFSPISNERED